MTGQLGVAFVTGMLATVNPCGFAMLPAFLGFYVGAGPDGAPADRPLMAGLRAGAAVSAGFAGVFALTGLVVAAGLRAVVGAIPWAAVVIGAALIVAGLVLLAGRRMPALRINLSRLNGLHSQASGTGMRAMAAYGGAYGVASLSCSLALLLAVVAQAAATGSVFTLLAVLIAYAVGSSTVLVLLAIASALARDSLARLLRRLLPVMSRLGGAALVLAGAYLIAYWSPALLGGHAGGPVGDVAASASATATSAIEAHPTAVVVPAALLIVLGVLGAVRRSRALSGGRSSKPSVESSGPGRRQAPTPTETCCPPAGPPAGASSAHGTSQGEPLR